MQTNSVDHSRIKAMRTDAIIHRRLEGVVRSWPHSLATTFRDYRQRTSGAIPLRGSASATKFSHPYWLLLPAWLMATYTKHRKLNSAEKRFLSDTLFAQYCLFLTFRIQDDLFDCQTRSQNLMFASDHLLLEAQNIFTMHFPLRNNFWKIYSACVRDTAAGIPVVDDLQRSPGTRPETLLASYPRVNAIFRIGAAAVCSRFHRMADYHRVETFSDRFSTATQILDDLTDMDEDLRQDRWNYAVNVIVRKWNITERNRSTVIRKIQRHFLSDAIGVMFLVDIERQLDHAFRALQPLKITSAEECFDVYRKSLNAMQHELFRARIQATRPGKSPRRSHGKVPER